MRLRHVMLTCAVLPMLPGTATAKTNAVVKEAATQKPGQNPGQKPYTTSTLSAAEMAAARASVLRMIDQIDISYQQFTLPNGLRVMVRTDRRAPVVNVAMWYDVGSKHEPAGRSGFAHLFEHLMFNGSENVPGDYLPRLMAIGADVNGSTTEDRTNYYQTVPTQALDLALFMESDRMGHFLGALSQASLDEQRGVVQNEKRNGSNSPTAVIGDMQRAALYSKGHPYGHSVIGSMKDLNAATVDDVRDFFRTHYGPNNATLILTGDIDLETARRLVTRYFGDIPAGPRNRRSEVAPTRLAKTTSQTATAPVTNPIITRVWPVPGGDSVESLELDGVAEAMGGSAQSPLQRHLIREQKLFQSLGVSNATSAQAGEFAITGTLRPGVDVAVATAALDREIALFLKQGVSADLLTKWIARYSYASTRTLSTVNGLATTLGETAVTYGDPKKVKSNLRFYAELTPAAATAAARKWLERPRWELTVTPGARMTPQDDVGIDGSAASRDTPTVAATVDSAPPAASIPAGMSKRGPLPIVGPPGDPRFPDVERVTLANGIPVLYARTGTIPYTMMAMSIEGGTLNEPTDQAGTLGMMYSLMGRGFAGMDEDRIRERLDLNGISLNVGGGTDSSGITLTAPDVNLERGLRMMHDMVSAPTFPVELIDRTKREYLDGRASSRLSTGVLAREVIAPLLDGGSPYLRSEMYGDGKVLRQIDRAKILAAYHRWVRPEHAKITLVSDKPLSELLPLLNRSLGTWKAAGPAQPVPAIVYHPNPGKPEIVVIDLPGAVQATIIGGQRVSITDTNPNEALNLASDVLGGGFTSRINMNLRENKHWTYGASANFGIRPYSSTYTAQMTVQQDKAGPAVAELMKEVRSAVDDTPISATEFAREKTARLGRLPTAYSEIWNVLGALQDIEKYKRPDDYPAKAAQRTRAVTLADANAALRGQLDASLWSWVIVGNAAIIRPQLDPLGLPVRVVKAADVLPPF